MCQVWIQAGYEAEYGTHAKFGSSLEQNPTLLHAFLECRAELIRNKLADPSCKFRLESRLSQVMESINTTQVKAQGLEAPETFFVDENAFEKHFGRKITDEELVTEEFNGVKMRGANVLTGRAGWFKRIDQDKNEVNRVANLTDDINLDASGQAFDNIHAAAKKEVFTKHVASVEYCMFPPIVHSKGKSEEAGA
ncbi:Uncharacterized protein (Fragment) [Durusdinium trenchii]|uniref:Uncharacterized protein n=1 Tax=Durusdinium trenchii TaxID=1381693 RepID=A0ABP0NTX0_9DINO